jgi:hypothetical protein
MAAPTLTTRTPERALRALVAPESLVLLAAAVLTVGLTGIVAVKGFTLPVAALFGVFVFLGVVAGFVAVPWLFVPAAIVLFSLIPTLKVFAGSSSGAAKDLISFAAVSAAAIAVVRRRAGRAPTQVDGPIALLIVLLLFLYLVNIGGLLTGETGHNAPWYQGVRLFFEPLSLLVAGMAMRNPRRTLHAGTAALLLSACAAAVYGVVQQGLGVNRLLSLGYTYGVEVRQINGNLRSFGTLGEPFSFASYLLIAIAVVLLSRSVRTRYVLVLVVLAAGLFFSYVRTAALIALAIIALALARRGHGLGAALLFAVAVAVAGVVFVVSSEAKATQSVPVNPTTYLTLNGRVKVWRQQLGKPGDWLFGRGVGAVGTAAERARESLSGKQEIGTQTTATVVDSGYLALVADVGIAGLVVMLALFGRVAGLARRSIRNDPSSAWLALGILVAMGIDALSRESFTAFPAAYVGWLLIGLCLAAAGSARPVPAR